MSEEEKKRLFEKIQKKDSSKRTPKQDLHDMYKYLVPGYLKAPLKVREEFLDWVIEEKERNRIDPKKHFIMSYTKRYRFKMRCFLSVAIIE